MTERRFTEREIAAILSEVDDGADPAEVCRRHGISEATYVSWRAGATTATRTLVRDVGAGNEPADDAATLIRDASGDAPGDAEETLLAADAPTLLRTAVQPAPDTLRIEPTERIDAQPSGPVGASDWGRPELWEDRHPAGITPGTIIKDRFLIEEELGVGGMGIVFKARDRRREETNAADPYVAIKVLNDEFRKHPQSLVSLQRETSKTHTLAHPNIITVFDFDRDGSTVYMTMELVRGGLLLDYISRHPGGIARDEALPIVTQMAEGLAYAHQRGFVHADFKPGNVFLTDDNRVKILDFGIARATKRTDDTFDAGELGALTPGYASPEMFKGAPPDPADDVFALAVTTYQLLSGEHPFGRRTGAEAASTALQPAPIRGLHRREWQAIRRGLAFQREDRIADAGEFLRRYRGPTKLAKASRATIAVLGLAAVFFAWQSLQAPGPDIPFEALSAGDQAAFRQWIDTGDSLLDMLPNESVGAYLEAYDLHPRNPDAERALDAAIEAYAGSYRFDAKSALDLEGDLRTVESWQARNDYLARHAALAAFRESLRDAVSQ